MAWREQAMSLLSTAGSHSDIAVKLSSFKQAKDILLSVEPAFAAELFPFLVELQYSQEPLVRRILLETIEEIGWKSMEHLPILIPIVVSYLRDSDHRIARQCIIIGTHLFCSVLEEIFTQIRRLNKVEWWVEELWKWLLRFKDCVLDLALEPGLVGTKILALKFLETCVLIFSSEPNGSDKTASEGRRQMFNISWIVNSHPLLDPVALKADGIRILGILLKFLQPSSGLPGSLTISAVTCLAAIGRKRPIHYNVILTALLDFDPTIDNVRGRHLGSIQYSLRTAFLGFLRSIYPEVLETREKLHRALRMMNAGEVADQVVRHVDKMIKFNERGSREIRDDVLSSSQAAMSWDQSRKRYGPVDDELDNGYEIAAKRTRVAANSTLIKPYKLNGSEMDVGFVNGSTVNVPVLNSDLTPAEKMISMIGALLAEGDRGAESLELLISTIHPDLLADIVIVNMKNLPKGLPSITRQENLTVSCHPNLVGIQPSGVANAHSPLSIQQESRSASNGSISILADVSSNHQSDSKRDPRRDPRRLDPRRPIPAGTSSEPLGDESGSRQQESDGSATLSRSLSGSGVASGPNKPEEMASDEPSTMKFDQANLFVIRAEGKFSASDINHVSDQINLPYKIAENSSPCKIPGLDTNCEMPADLESDDPPLSPSTSNVSVPEDTNLGLPELPQYVEMSREQQKVVGKLAIERIIDSYNYFPGNTCNEIRITLLSRFIALNTSDDDIVSILQKHVALDYGQKKGHELVLHVLYQLYSLVTQDSAGNFPHAPIAYEKILLAIGKSLLDIFPASDKSFSRLLGDVPFLPESTLKLLDDLCFSDVVDSNGKEVRDSERATQGLGAVWGVILGRPNDRNACLDIALKCAAHSQEDIRAKAIRLVANKLFQLDYISDKIEEFTTNLLLKAVNHDTCERDGPQPTSVDTGDGESANEELSVSCSQVSEGRNGETSSATGMNPVVRSGASISFPEAQRHTSLYFALCTKKPSLLRLIFDVYGRAPKTVKQVIHRHVPIVVRSLSSCYAELFNIMSDPPEGCENLLMLVLQILTEESSPSKELIETVKHLFESKLQDAMILIPILSSLSKDEVLPVFPRLVNLPVEKFQMALAHILQGSAHTGPALTPAEVLVAIHDIVPERDGLPLKKITDACSTCFEQRTVFTQQVLARALNQMVDQTPLPLLFMRTVIQAVDAFPSLVDFVMEILSKLVNRQVWKMPKLWVGFLKCASQTRPHSFSVLLQLPPPQLETALNKHANLRSPLASYASQPCVKSSTPRPILVVLGLANESNTQQPHVASLQPANAGVEAQGTTLT